MRGEPNALTLFYFVMPEVHEIIWQRGAWLDGEWLEGGAKHFVKLLRLRRDIDVETQNAGLVHRSRHGERIVGG